MLDDLKRKIVEENHDLIYWYLNLKGLTYDDYYDLVAIELCLAVDKYDSTKGSLANYFKVRCDNMVYKEWRKESTAKKSSNGIIPLDEEHMICDHQDMFGKVEHEELLNDPTGVARLRSKGFSQQEVAEILGISQSRVSAILGRLREEYNVDR
jgi:RNA polymerase sigma factor (sigma-70 family)